MGCFWSKIDPPPPHLFLCVIWILRRIPVRTSILDRGETIISNVQRSAKQSACAEGARGRFSQTFPADVFPFGNVPYLYPTVPAPSDIYSGVEFSAEIFLVDYVFLTRALYKSMVFFSSLLGRGGGHGTRSPPPPPRVREKGRSCGLWCIFGDSPWDTE